SFEPPSAEPVLVFALASPVSEVPPEASPPSALPDSLPPLLLAARAPLVALDEASPDSGLPLFSESAFVTSAGSELALETATFFASPLSFPPDRAPDPAFAVEEPLPASPDSVLPEWALPVPVLSPLSAEVSLPPVLPPSADWTGTLACTFVASPDSALPVSLP